jgi:hypothetical protein
MQLEHFGVWAKRLRRVAGRPDGWRRGRLIISGAGRMRSTRCRRRAAAMRSWRKRTIRALHSHPVMRRCGCDPMASGKHVSSDSYDRIAPDIAQA